MRIQFFKLALTILIFRICGAETQNRCRLVDRAYISVGLGFPRNENRVHSIGNLTATVIFVDFSDVPATMKPEKVFNILSPGAENYFSSVSYGKLSLILKPNFFWLRMSKLSTEYNMWGYISFNNQYAYINEAVALAMAASIDLTSSDEIIVMSSPNSTALSYGAALCGTPYPNNSFKVSNNTIWNAVTSGIYDEKSLIFSWLNHEIGHTLGLPDLYNTIDGSSQFKFTGSFSAMSNIYGAGKEYFAFERFLLGWLDDSQVECVNQSGEFKISPIEVLGGNIKTKLVMIPFDDHTAVVAEYRAALGFDRDLPKPGVLVYFVDTSIKSGLGIVKVLPYDEIDLDKLGKTLIAGESVTYNNVTVRNLEIQENDYVKIKIENNNNILL